MYNITQIKSNNGKNFKPLHIIIQIKSWLRTISTHVSKKHIQKYFDEFCYRINRLQTKDYIFNNAIIRMVNSNPFSHKQTIQKLN